MRSRRQYGKLLGIAGAVTLFGGLLAYWLTSKASEASEEPLDKSRCIIITASIADETRWTPLLDEDVVLVVAPGVDFPHKSYKVIRCDTMTGLWSCVRHLKKDQLLLKPNDLESPMPADIPRYTAHITQID